jgi:hypothetical protein
MSTVESIVDEIIALGREHDWFIDFLFGLSENDYITAKGNVIFIDTTCIKVFLDEDRTTSDDELEEYLREMIQIKIPESVDYQIMVQIKNNFI